MRTLVVIGMALVSAAAGSAQGTDDRSRLSGTWESKDSHEKWVIDEKPDAVRLVRSESDQKKLEIQCNTMGRECPLKDEGKKAAVSIWYSGPKLVELETRGSDVVKRRFKISEDGHSLEMEIIPVLPAGKTETVRLERVDSASSSDSAKK